MIVVCIGADAAVVGCEMDSRGKGVCCNFRIERTKLGSGLRKRQSDLD